jgi:hypothetical protein
LRYFPPSHFPRQALLDGDKIEDLKRMYLLFGRVKSQALLQQAWLLYCRYAFPSA